MQQRLEEHQTGEEPPLRKMRLTVAGAFLERSRTLTTLRTSDSSSEEQLENASDAFWAVFKQYMACGTPEDAENTPWHM